MIFVFCAAQLSGTVCPDCGGMHEVSVRFDDRCLLTFSVDDSAQSCAGFHDLVASRLSSCRNREQKRKAEWLLRRALGDPSL